MKKVPSLFLLAAAFFSDPLVAQPDRAAEAAVIADRKEAEEEYRIYIAKVQDLLDAQDLILKRQDSLRDQLNNLAGEIEKLREENSRNSGQYVAREELKRYVEKLKEIDDKREADKRLFLEKIQELAKMPFSAPGKSQEKRAPAETEPGASGNFYKYTVGKDETLSEILAEYNADFKKKGLGSISLDQVEKANPGLKPNRIMIGQEILIPIPPKK